MNRRKRFIEWCNRHTLAGFFAAVACIVLMAVTLQAVAVTGYQDYQVISTPGNPASQYLRFFATTGALNCLTSGGASCFPSGFTAGGDLSGSSTSQTVIKVNGGSIPASATFAATNSSSQITALTATQATAALNAFTSSLQGVAPSSGGGTTNFLRADGSWAAPAGGGPSSQNVVTGSRALNGSNSSPTHVYQNTTGKPMWVSVVIDQNAAVTTEIAGTAYSDSAATPTTAVAGWNFNTGQQFLTQTLSFLVLPSNYYFVYAPTIGGGSPVLAQWIEWE